MVGVSHDLNGRTNLFRTLLEILTAFFIQRFRESDTVGLYDLAVPCSQLRVPESAAEPDKASSNYP
jgi:hypothetical protein